MIHGTNVNRKKRIELGNEKHPFMTVCNNKEANDFSSGVSSRAWDSPLIIKRTNV